MTGSRGLRSILEEIMRDVMYEIPSNPKIEKCIITEQTVQNSEKPEVIINENKEPRKPVKKKRIEKNKIETA